MAQSKVRYAVVGLGYIAQAAVLPSFAHARRNSSLHAIVSGSVEKLNEIGDKYRIPVRATLRRLRPRAAGSGRRLHLHAELRARGLRGARRQGRQARVVREAARGDAGGVPPHDQGGQAGRRQDHDRLPPALRAAVPRSARHRPLGQDRRAALLQLVVLDARQAGRHPHPARARRRHALRSRRLLHQHRAPDVRRGADVGVRARRSTARARTCRRSTR